MTKGQLKEILAVCDGAGMEDNVQIQLEGPAGRINLHGTAFKIERKDVNYGLDASEHWAPVSVQEDTIVLKQG